MDKNTNGTVFDARGNGDGETSNTITGDHNNRVTDYTPVVCQDATCFNGGGFADRKEEDVSGPITATGEDHVRGDTKIVCVKKPPSSMDSNIYRCAKCGRIPEMRTFDIDELIEPIIQGVEIGIAVKVYGCVECGQKFSTAEKWNERQVKIRYRQKVLACIDGDKLGKKERKGGSGLGVADGDVMYTQTAKDVHAVALEQDISQMAQMTVRRLLPIETERLMGFPDNWTRIPWKGKPEEECPDSPRYKACGNSMCVNCMEWLGRRIQMEEERIQEALNEDPQKHGEDNRTYEEEAGCKRDGCQDDLSVSDESAVQVDSFGGQMDEARDGERK